MTNLEWIRTLSEEEFADWLYDEWLHHLQYRWSSSRGGLIIWLKDRKTEPTISKMEQVETMSCQECKHFHENAVMYLDKCDFCFKDCNYEPKDEPQTQLTAKCLECNNSKACKENHWQGCRYEPLGYEVTAVVGTIKDEPQTEVYDYKGNGKWERSE